MQFNDELWKLIEAAPGWCWREKAEGIHRLASQSFIKRAVEIGVFGGRSFVPLVAAMIPRGGMCIGYDVYKPHKVRDSEAQQWWDNLAYEDLFEGARTLMRKLGFPPEIIQTDSSANAARMYEDGSLQYVHVDGSHDPWDAAEDIVLWTRRLGSGGYLLVDDTNWEQLRIAKLLLPYGGIDLIETLVNPMPGASGETQIWKKR